MIFSIIEQINLTILLDLEIRTTYCFWVAPQAFGVNALVGLTQESRGLATKKYVGGAYC